MKLSIEEAHHTPCPMTGFKDGCRTGLCPVWRWSRAKETAAYLTAVQERMLIEGEQFNKAAQVVWAESAGSFEQVEGYCGLGGRPE